MGQKVNPLGIRLGIVYDEFSTWYAPKKEYADKLLADIRTRAFIKKMLTKKKSDKKIDSASDPGIANIRIRRPAKNALITVYAARPGVIIGQKGKGIETLRSEVAKVIGVPVHINIEEVRKPELSARLTAESVARQLEQRIMFRRAMKRAVTNALRAGALGVKICVSGRLGGAEIARSEWYREGRVPLHTFRADIDYALEEAMTTYGVIGVKVWIFKGEVLGHKKQELPTVSDKA